MFGGCNRFGQSSTSSPFGQTNIFGGTTCTGVFGATQSSSPLTASTPTFGASASSPAFGSSMPAFGASSSSFGGKPVFGGFGLQSSPAFGATTTPAFGATTTPAFGATSSTPAFGSTVSPTFGSTGNTPAFGSTASPTFGSTGSTAFAPVFGSGGAFGATSTPAFGATITPAFGATSSTPAFGSTASPTFGSTGSTAFAPVFGSGGAFGATSTPAFGATTTPAFGATSSTPAFGSTASPTFGSTGSTAFAPVFGSGGAFGATSTPAFGATTTPAFGATSSTPAFGSTASPTFGSTGNTAFAPVFGSGGAFGATSTPAFGATTTPAFGATSSTPAFGSTASPTFGSTGSTAFGVSISAPVFGSGGAFGATAAINEDKSHEELRWKAYQSAAATGFGANTQSNPSSATPSIFGPSAPGFSPNTTSPSLSGPSSMDREQVSSKPSTERVGAAVAQPVPVTNPFGTLPAMPQMSIGRAPSIQYGISSLPVVDKPAPPMRIISPLLTSRHLSQRSIRLPAIRKYNPQNDAPKVPFFAHDPKADALFIPRENPRSALVMEHWPARGNAKKASLSKDPSTPVLHENGKTSETVSTSPFNAEDKNIPVENGEPAPPVKLNGKTNGIQEDDHSIQKQDSYITTLTGHRADHVEALMPKLRHSDYYTEPQIQELERADPGFCQRVKDFVVGRHGYGSIKFFGETDVRRLDLESLVQFNSREVIVYMDESKKPPVGQGLNKPAEVTLLNIKCFDKKTGRQYTDGPRIDKYKEMLKRKTEDQGAEFVSYDPVKGEWKFRVNHFSMSKN